ncbi:Type II inositol 1,4,5-trisphosphate 5-phosphatase [Diaporthe amygdali]|uniref:Type II inositol 1,4,5-trisphosphate 5-phosphatase n=1 Tax=Phomopsis amygdali TaxID=1214568 RepID=UPI0022FECF30|nr:Type II inositol 1,4,5-trisphosphate 5-phosphatase [Diaporthe amygdali]KAJ0121873.1 Type II inositol 1,4,5-trisphosphate 5-phosphatase [Diaporthe amygdali]
MGYNTDSVEWPRGTYIPEPVKRLIDRFYNLLDDDDSGVGSILADEIFTLDGVAYFGGQPFKGTDGEGAERVLRVYVADTDASDLLFIASVTMGLRNGKQVEGEFAGRLLIADATGSNPRLRLYQVWGDSSALMKALQP